MHGRVLPLIEQVTEAAVCGLELHEQTTGRIVVQLDTDELGVTATSATAIDAFVKAIQVSSPSLVMLAMRVPLRLVAPGRLAELQAPSRSAFPIKGSDESSSIP